MQQQQQDKSQPTLADAFPAAATNFSAAPTGISPVPVPQSE